MKLTTPCPDPTAIGAFRDRVAPCTGCGCVVHDLTEATPEEVAAVVASAPRVCARWLRLPGEHVATRPMVVAAAAAVLAACGPEADVQTLADATVARLAATDVRRPAGGHPGARTLRAAGDGADAVVRAVLGPPGGRVDVHVDGGI